MSSPVKYAMIPRLFIGGSADGMLVKVREGETRWVFHTKKEDPDLMDFSKPVEDKVLEVTTENYTASFVHFGEERFTVFVLEGMTLAQAFVRLLQFYKPPKEDDNE